MSDVAKNVLADMLAKAQSATPSPSEPVGECPACGHDLSQPVVEEPVDA